MTKDDLDLPADKQVPKLISGNEAITVDPSIVIRSDDGTSTFPTDAESKAKSGKDILRGMLSIPGKTAYGFEFQDTLVVLDVPTTYENYQCKFHFIVGGGDFVQGRIALWQLASLPVEFQTTFDNKPETSGYIGWFLPALGEKISMTDGDGNDALWDFGGSEFVEPENECGPDRKECKSLPFPCKSIIGKYGYQMQFDPEKSDATDVTGSAWSMNKGLIVEVVGAPAQERAYTTPCCKVYEESQGNIQQR